MRVFTWIHRVLTAVGFGASWALAILLLFGTGVIPIVLAISTSPLIAHITLTRFWLYRDGSIPRFWPMRIRRHCYDKPHRCPGWAGGGRKIPRNGTSICQDGRLDLHMYEKRLWQWRFRRCEDCGTVTLPIMVKYIDPLWWVLWMMPLWRLRFSNWREDRRDVR